LSPNIVPIQSIDFRSDHFPFVEVGTGIQGPF
ncbi:hypothetical protein WICPIJ_008418, partial [Wickerhamomyces pijperi]